MPVIVFCISKLFPSRRSWQKMEDLTVGQSQFRRGIAVSKNVNNFFLFFLRRANKLTDNKYTAFICDVFNPLSVERNDRFGNLVLVFLLHFILCPHSLNISSRYSLKWFPNRENSQLSNENIRQKIKKSTHLAAVHFSIICQYLIEFSFEIYFLWFSCFYNRAIICRDHAQRYWQ